MAGRGRGGWSFSWKMVQSPRVAYLAVARGDLLRTEELRAARKQGSARAEDALAIASRMDRPYGFPCLMLPA